MVSKYIDEASERSKTSHAPAQIIPLFPDRQREMERMQLVDRMIMTAEFHASLLETLDKPGEMLAFASRLEHLAKEIRKAVRGK